VHYATLCGSVFQHILLRLRVLTPATGRARPSFNPSGRVSALFLPASTVIASEAKQSQD